jgi:hypothetical protein
VNLVLLLWLGLRLDGYVAAPLRKHLNLEQTQGTMIDLKSLMGLINSVLQIWCDKHSCRQPAEWLKCKLISDLWWQHASVSTLTAGAACTALKWLSQARRRLM